MDRNKLYDILEHIANNFPEANLQLIAIGLGAITAVEIKGGVLNITLKDGSGFAFIRGESNEPRT